MNLLIAPDSFKESLSAIEVTEQLKKGILSTFPEATIRSLPISDGGEGWVHTLIHSLKGSIIHVPSKDPLMRDINAFFGKAGNLAVIEIASASGLHLLNSEERQINTTSTYGTGLLIKAALDAGCDSIILGLGGSATNDAGTGMASALGVRFLDSSGKELASGGQPLNDLYEIDMQSLDPRLSDCKLLAACDVDNPLYGEMGATRIFGPQKGGSQEDVNTIDAALEHLHGLVKDQLNIDMNHPGSGAAGGTGGGVFAFLGGELTSGFDIVSEHLKLVEQIQWADIVVTGEGRIDEQTFMGKGPGRVFELGRENKKAVILVGGSIKREVVSSFDKNSVFSLMNGERTLEYCLTNAGRLLKEEGEKMGQLLKTKNW